MSEESEKEQAAQNTQKTGAEKASFASQTAASSPEGGLAHLRAQNLMSDECEDRKVNLEDLDCDVSWDSAIEMSLADVSKMASSSDIWGRHQHFQSKRALFWQRYAQRGIERSEPIEENLHFFGDWSVVPSRQAHIDWPKRENNTSGLFFRWNGLGIALNPSTGFLEEFHKKDLFIADLHAVISTRPDPKVHEMLEQIYTLNATFNEVSERKHKIDYYLCAGSHKELFHRLEPRYKQERNSVFCLERYVDSDEVESYTLGNGIGLCYNYQEAGHEAGIAFQLQLPTAEEDLAGKNANDHFQILKLGYLPKSFTSYSQNQLFENCDLLIISLQSLENDSGKAPNTDTSAELEMNPLIQFLQKARSKVVLLCDFSTADGDLRLEMAKHLKAQLGERMSGDLAPILPADGNLQLEMATWRVKCAVTGHWIPAPFANVLRTQECFGELMYLGSDCVL